jgi:hypothetical protein
LYGSNHPTISIPSCSGPGLSESPTLQNPTVAFSTITTDVADTFILVTPKTRPTARPRPLWPPRGIRFRNFTLLAYRAGPWSAIAELHWSRRGVRLRFIHVGLFHGAKAPMKAMCVTRRRRAVVLASLTQRRTGEPVHNEPAGLTSWAEFSLLHHPSLSTARSYINTVTMCLKVHTDIKDLKLSIILKQWVFGESFNVSSKCSSKAIPRRANPTLRDSSYYYDLLPIVLCFGL